MTKAQGLSLAHLLQRSLHERGFPIQRVLLFGSYARGKPRKDSDIDIAVICEPFRKTRHEENVEFLSAGHDIDLHIETICLHPEDMGNKYSTIVQEVKKYGIPV